MSPTERWAGHPQRAYRVHATDQGRFVELRATTRRAGASGPESLAITGDPRALLAVYPRAQMDPGSPQIFTLLNRAGDRCVVEVLRPVLLERRLLEAPAEAAGSAPPAPQALALEVGPAGCEHAVVALPGAHPRAWLEPVPLQRVAGDVLEGVTPETRLHTTLSFSPSVGGGCPGLPATLRFDLDAARQVSLHVEQQVIELFLLHTGVEDLVWVGHVGASAVYRLSDGTLVETFAEMRDVGLGAGCTAGR